MNKVLTLTSAMGAEVPTDSYILASPVHIDALKAAAAGLENDLNLVALENSSPISEQILSVAKVLVLEVEPSSASSLARIRDARSKRPDITIVAAINNPDFGLVRTLLRQGVADVVELPFNAQDLLSQLFDIHSRESHSEDDLAPMIAVVGAAGGVGTSTVLTHLAASLAQDSSCCLIDMDMQSGYSTHLLNVAPTNTVQDVLDASERLDGDMLKDAAIQSESGIAVLGAPDRIEPLEDVDIDRLLRLLAIARREYDYVLLDVPSNWTNWSLSVVSACQAIAIVTDQSINGLRGAKRLLELFEGVDLPTRNVGLIVNKVERRLFRTIDKRDISDTLGCQIWGELPLDTEALSAAQDRCQLIWSESHRAPFGKSIHQLAADFKLRLAGEMQ